MNENEAVLAVVIVACSTFLLVVTAVAINVRKIIEARRGSTTIHSDEVNSLRHEVQELRGAVHDLMLQVEMGEKPVQVADRLIPPEFNKH